MGYQSGKAGAPSPGLMKSMQFLKQAQVEEGAANLQKAVLYYQAAIKSCPDNGLPYRGLLLLLLGHRDFDNIGKLLSQTPASVLQRSDMVRYIQAVHLLESGQPEDAIPVFKSLTGSSEVPGRDVFHNLATCFSHIEDYTQALAGYRRAHELGLDVPELWMNIACAEKKRGQFALAESAFADALARYPGDPGIRYEYALFRLGEGDFDAGFDHYEARWQAPQFSGEKPTPQAPALSAITSDSRVMVVAEQGVGDQLLYAVSLAPLTRLAAAVALVVDDRLVSLMARSFPQVSVRGRSTLIDDSPSLADFDGWMMAPDVCRHVPFDPQAGHDFLAPDPERAAHFRAKYRARYPGKRIVGLSWKSKRRKLGARKSIDLLDWAPILATDDCIFVCLQYGDVADDISAVRAQLGVDIVVDDEVDLFDGLDEFAALVAAMDHVISTSNTTAHFAAGVGTDLMLMAPSGLGLLWYWGHGGDRCRWYPAIRIFRPDQIGQWDPVIARVAEALAETGPG